MISKSLYTRKLAQRMFSTSADSFTFKLVSFNLR